METDEVLAEPQVDRWPEATSGHVEKPTEASGLQIFSLSGGLMRSTAKTANRIDGLLTRMMEQPTSGKYRSNLDSNLDYLLTSLQLDMIEMLAQDYSGSCEATDREQLEGTRRSPFEE